MLNGGSGNDLIDTGPRGRSIVGTEISDTAFGGNGTDTILGSNGNDELRGESGNDFIDGAQGNDTIFGGAGSDTLLGDVGGDSIVGGNGDDLLLGDQGGDVIRGGLGRDVIFAGAGRDQLLAGGGDDLLVTGTITVPVTLALGIDVQREWLSDNSYDQRVVNIRNGAGRSSNRLNDDHLVGLNRNGRNVFTDGDTNEVTGGTGLDFFYYDLDNDITDREDDERLDRI